MSPMPTRFARTILAFAGLFRQRTWRYAEHLVVGAILTPGLSAVASALRVLGRAQERRFTTYHRALSRAMWSPRRASRVLLELLVRAFVPTGPIVLGSTIRSSGAAARESRRRHLPRSGALLAQSFREGEWTALALRHAVGTAPVGQVHLGAAGAHGAHALGALRRGTRPAA